MNIYVANISFRVKEDDLKGLFSQYGEIKTLKILTDKMTGRSRGFGFVEMDDEGGAKAIAELDGKDFMERPLKVNEARPREEGSEGGYRKNNNRGGDREFGDKF